MNQRPSLSASGGESDLRSALRDWSTISAPERVHLKFDSSSSPTTPEIGPRRFAGCEHAHLLGSHRSVRSEFPAGADRGSPARRAESGSAAPAGSPSRSGGLARRDGQRHRSKRRRLRWSADDSRRGIARGGEWDGIATSDRLDSLVIRPNPRARQSGMGGKFVAAALEEYGWQVDARLFVPRSGNDVVQGTQAW